MNIVRLFNIIFSSISYLTEEQSLIDCGEWHKEYENVLNVLLTHAHFDHIYGLNDLVAHCPNAKIFTNEYGKEMLLNAKKNLSHYQETPFVFSKPEAIHLVEDGNEIEIGNNLIAKAIFTPGHNPSCISWQIGDALFTGDAYIPGVKTVTNLPGGNKAQAAESLKKILKLAESCSIFPGHKIDL